MNLLNYYHTLKYLKISQLYHRLLLLVPSHRLKTFDYSLSLKINKWKIFKLYDQKVFLGGEVLFLNKKGRIKSSTEWNDVTKEKLWLYNLHYFDDLNALDSENRTGLHSQLILKWIEDNPAITGNGWEPYPTSLRIVNWIKSFLSGLKTEKIMLDSLVFQVGFLSKNLEFHLLGNHLLANAKALIFAGLYFEGKEARSWLKTGLNIYNRELKEQVLKDGGNFELSPMYHSIVLADLLDLYNIFTTFENKVDKYIIEKTKLTVLKMDEWLKLMTHPDGEISFFNDTAMGIAAKPKLLHSYSRLLGIISVNLDFPLYMQLPESGYSRITMPNHSVLIDHAQVGPDYIPGHAHADTLSIEWSVGLQRVLVNSGTSLYGNTSERLRQRKTESHNTVVVDSKDSSEVWSGFRVARRAYTMLHKVIEEEELVSIEASHNGFMRLKGKVTHTRKVVAEPNVLRIMDTLNGKYETGEAIFHIHPDVNIYETDGNSLQLILPNQSIICVSSNCLMLIESTTWHPQFGLSIPNKKIRVIFSSNEVTTTFLLIGS